MRLPEADIAIIDRGAIVARPLTHRLRARGGGACGRGCADGSGAHQDEPGWLQGVHGGIVRASATSRRHRRRRPYEVARTRAAMQAQAEQQAAKMLALDQQIAQKAAEADGIAAMIDKIEAALPFIEETAEVREKVMKIEFGNRIAHLDAQLRLTDQRHDLVVQRRWAERPSSTLQFYRAVKCWHLNLTSTIDAAVMSSSREK